MIEAVIIAMILSSVVLKVGGNVAVDVAHAVRGKESPRYARAKARSWMPKKPSGAASRYWSQIWEDSWSQRLKKHEAKVAGDRPDKPRGAARIFWTGLGQDARRSVLRKWDQGWTGLDEKRRSRSTRVPDGTDVVPGEVVPDAPVPAEPEPVLVDQTDGGTDLQFGTDPTDPTGTRSCTACGGKVVVDGEICGACQYRQQQRDQYWESQGNTPPSTTPEPTGHPEPPADTHPADQLIELLGQAKIIRIEPQQHPTQEGNTMTMTSTEVVGLDQAISYCEHSAKAHREQIIVIERTQAALSAGDVQGPAAGYLAQAMEANTSAASAMDSAAAELAKQKTIQEGYDAVQGAGSREFITGGR